MKGREYLDYQIIKKDSVPYSTESGFAYFKALFFHPTSGGARGTREFVTVLHTGY
jgi:hypothetical protein